MVSTRLGASQLIKKIIDYFSNYIVLPTLKVSKQTNQSVNKKNFEWQGKKEINKDGNNKYL